MITIAEFSKMLTNENEIIHLQTKDLTQSNTLIQPQPGGNCMNWVLGHLLDGLISILKVLNGKIPENLPDLERYQRESSPILEDESGVLSLDLLLKYLDRVNVRVIECLVSMDEADLDQEIELWSRKVKRGWAAFFYHFHYTYHLGQLEYLRNLAGKTEKVI
ncbi:MAG: DinB family protein [Anaerolineaceae bacterium]|nr:DinB family protein [Anaerolineaceae bacterium]